MHRITLSVIAVAASFVLAACSHAETPCASSVSVPDPSKPSQQVVRTASGVQISGAEATAIRNKIRTCNLTPAK